MKTTFKNDYLKEVRGVSQELTDNNFFLMENIEQKQKLFIEALYKIDNPIFDYSQFYTSGFGRNCFLLKTIAKKLYKSNTIYNLYLESQKSKTPETEIPKILEAFFEIIQLEKNNT